MIALISIVIYTLANPLTGACWLVIELLCLHLVWNEFTAKEEELHPIDAYVTLAAFIGSALGIVLGGMTIRFFDAIRRIWKKTGLTSR